MNIESKEEETMLYMLIGINQIKELFSRMGQRQEKGQTLIEYALILALVIIIVIVAMNALTPKISGTYNTMGNKLP
jgi:Flp pilus assembly pilin Flp